MRGIKTTKSRIRSQIFTEIAKLAYAGYDRKKFEELPYKIIQGETAKYRDSIFVEREVVAERLRAAMGVSLRDITQYSSIGDGVEEALNGEQYYEAPLIDIIKFACNRCPEKRYVITNGCQNCLERPCMEICPKQAISRENGRTTIDPDKCIKCGLCASACEFNAIIKQERPCMKVCGMNAIGSDELGRANIDQNKCVGCGACLVSCPFSAIIDKSQIFQTISAIKNSEEVYAAIAPSFINQFGDNVSAGKLRTAFKEMGFTDIYEVAVGADLCTIEEALDFREKVPHKQPFMATSCCPAWTSMAKKYFPELAHCISMTMTPMALTGRLLKQQHPGCKVVFVGPCAAKKSEAADHSVRSDIDYVLTYEELAAILEAKKIVVNECEESESFMQASKDAIGFAVSGGVANSVNNALKHLGYDEEVKVMKAEGLPDCKKMLTLAKAGKYNGYLLEGMGCVGGCVGGAGVIVQAKKAAAGLTKTMSETVVENAATADYLMNLPQGE